MFNFKDNKEEAFLIIIKTRHQRYLHLAFVIIVYLKWEMGNKY